jgi:hypothetical protein
MALPLGKSPWSRIGLATASRFVDEGAQEPADATHVMRRSSSQGAGQLLRAIVANDDQPVTADDIAMAGAADSLPARVRGARERRAAGMRYRTTNYERWRAAADTFAIAMSEPRERDLGLSRSIAPPAPADPHERTWALVSLPG